VTQDADPIHIALPDEAATVSLAGRLAPWLRRGDLVALWGDLGAGKTALARAVIRALRPPDGEAEEVPSPTFTLVQTYDTAAGSVWHFDLYRVREAGELAELGWDDALDQGIVLVEWPERAGTKLPVRRLDIRLGFAPAEGPGARVAQLSAAGGWEMDRQAGGLAALQAGPG
jgi:tRNA threonylcarbamoyladenosine biosynthesis protein TsaE